MTIQQLLYAIEIEKQGSINAAATILFISQPTLSIAIRELEKEIGFNIFKRNNKGIILTENGIEFIYYAKNVLMQMESLTNYCHHKTKSFSNKLFVSSQHYAFVSDAFSEYIKDFENEEYNFKIKETQSITAIDDVIHGKSDLAFILINTFNRLFLSEIFEKRGIAYHKICDVTTHVFLSEKHPLANKKSINLDDLEPYPVVVYEQEGNELFAEELIIQSDLKKVIYINDRATSMSVIANSNGYNLGTGYLSKEMYDVGMRAIPLENDIGEKEIVWIHLEKIKPTNQTLEFVSLVEKKLLENSAI